MVNIKIINTINNVRNKDNHYEGINKKIRIKIVMITIVIIIIMVIMRETVKHTLYSIDYLL